MAQFSVKIMRLTGSVLGENQQFLVSVRKITQHATHSTYAWVPMQSWDRIWTDEELYAKYSISPEEAAYIASQVRGLSLDDGDDE